MIEIKDSKLFFELQSKFSQITYDQSQAWCNYLLSKKEEIVFYVDDEKDTQILFWGRKKKLPFISKYLLLIDTPLLQPGLSEKTIRKRFLSLIEHDYVGFQIDSINEYEVEFEVGLRRAGFVRPLSLFKCPLTSIINLQDDIRYDANWKRNVANSQKKGISVVEINEPSYSDAATFCRIFNETKKMKGLSYSLEPADIFALIKHPTIRLFQAVDSQSVVSMQIFYCNNKKCYSIYRANSFNSRKNNAAYLLYNEIFKVLSNEGFESYDMGRIPPSNHNTDLVYIFKNATRARKIQYNGEWVLYKKKWIEYLMFVYKRFITKKTRY